MRQCPLPRRLHRPPGETRVKIIRIFLFTAAEAALPVGLCLSGAEPLSPPEGDCGGSGSPSSLLPDSHGGNAEFSPAFRFLPPNPQTILHIFKSLAVSSRSCSPRPPKREKEITKPVICLRPRTPSIRARARRLEGGARPDGRFNGAPRVTVRPRRAQPAGICIHIKRSSKKCRHANHLDGLLGAEPARKSIFWFLKGNLLARRWRSRAARRPWKGAAVVCPSVRWRAAGCGGPCRPWPRWTTDREQGGTRSHHQPGHGAWLGWLCAPEQEAWPL